MKKNNALYRLRSSTITVRTSIILLDVQKKISKVNITVAPDVELTYFLIHDRAKPRDIRIKLSRGATMKLYGICISTVGEQQIDVHVEHAEPQSTSFVSLKGVFTGQAKGIINGTIHIHKAAQGSNARLEERVLLLSPQASAKTIPNLEIEANDVKASHAATVSSISDEDIFYLQTRGLSKRRAEQHIVLGFISSTLDTLPRTKARDKLIVDVIQRLQ